MSNSGFPYRDSVQALKERLGAIEAELLDLQKRAAEAETLKARQQQLQIEQARIAAQLHKRGLPLLDQARVASPCSANWNEMVGNDQVRHCASCDKNVYNLSAMTRDEAENLLRSSTGELCIRFYRRADGTVMTVDCPVGVRKKRRRQAAFGAAGAGAMLAATAFATLSTSVMGSKAAPTIPGTGSEDSEVRQPVQGGYGGELAPTMGSAPMPNQPPPAKPPQAKIGKRAR